MSIPIIENFTATSFEEVETRLRLSNRMWDFRLVVERYPSHTRMHRENEIFSYHWMMPGSQSQEIAMWIPCTFFASIFTPFRVYGIVIRERHER